jgi:hypothetical protein
MKFYRNMIICVVDLYDGEECASDEEWIGTPPLTRREAVTREKCDKLHGLRCLTVP